MKKMLVLLLILSFPAQAELRFGVSHVDVRDMSEGIKSFTDLFQSNDFTMEIYESPRTPGFDITHRAYYEDGFLDISYRSLGTTEVSFDGRGTSLHCEPGEFNEFGSFDIDLISIQIGKSKGPFYAKMGAGFYQVDFSTHANYVINEVPGVSSNRFHIRGVSLVWGVGIESDIFFLEYQRIENMKIGQNVDPFYDRTGFTDIQTLTVGVRHEI